MHSLAIVDSSCIEQLLNALPRSYGDLAHSLPQGKRHLHECAQAVHNLMR